MAHSRYVIRNYQPEDFDKYCPLNIEAAKLELALENFISSKDVAEQLGQPNYSSEQDLFVVELARNIVGYMNVVPELSIGRVILSCWIQPEHRRKKLATRLLGYAMHRAKELGAEVAHVNVREDNAVAQTVLSGLDFESVRCFLDLRLDMTKVRQRDIDRAALSCRHLESGEEDKLTWIQNRSFAGTWGYNLNTMEEVTYRTHQSNFSPDDVVLACSGDKITGYCWTAITDKSSTSDGERKGRILMLGADPDYRGKWIGKRVLLAGLAHIKSKGLGVAELTVDSENKVAYGLYRLIGFELRTRNFWYEKVIN